MLFTTPIFPLFFGVVYLLYRALPAALAPRAALRAQNLWLLLASYLFYAWWDWRLCGLILLSTAVDYGCGLALSKHRSKLWVALSVSLNLGVLALFKYLGWFTEELNALLAALHLGTSLPVLKLAVPVGLSFYTFQSMAYTIDVHRDQARVQRDPLTFALFVSFFPQLVAGPIERSHDLMPQLESPRSPTPEQLARGLHLILWGAFKKIFVADNLAVLVERVVDGTATPQTGAAVWVATYAFAWQIYCDFSGYTDMARGLAKLLGIELSLNFRAPFLARSPADLWRRWHISLSRWLRDYLYIPLGGNRKGRLRTQRNLMVTMLLGGLWHGANWTYVVWGAGHGLALAVHRLVGERRLGAPGRILATLATFHMTALLFLIFRSPNLSRAWQLLSVQFSNIYMSSEDRLAFAQLGVLIAIPASIELWEHLSGKADLVLRWPKPLQAVFSVIILLMTLVLGATAGQTFIYFQF